MDTQFTQHTLNTLFDTFSDWAKIAKNIAAQANTKEIYTTFTAKYDAYIRVAALVAEFETCLATTQTPHTEHNREDSRNIIT